ncbi:MAG: hypothetical protein ACXWXY_10975, partial [Aeromicrobium sp.]
MRYQFTCFGGIIGDSCGGEVKPSDTWENMAEWLSGSFAWIRAGSVLQLEPEGITDFSTDAAVVCAQVRKLDDGALWLRLSDRSLGVPNVARLSAEGLALDVWQDEDLLEDCTEAQMFSRDAELLADVCVTWFRDRRDFDSPDEVGWEYEPPEELPRLLRYHDPRPPRDDQLEDLDDLAQDWALRQDEDAFWCDDKTLAMTVYDVQLRLVVRPRKRKLTIAAVLDLNFYWPRVLG